MSSHPIDFLLLGNNFGTPEMREIWSEQNRLTQQINVEVALALAEGELGVIPQQAALSIAELANASQLNIKDIAASGAQMKHSLMPVLTALQQQCGDAGEYIHYGATTQDIIDTATVLQLAQTLKVIVRDSTAVANELKALAREHQYTLMTGRTHGMQALPTTFGFKVAVWLDEFIRHLDRLAAITPRLLTGNISGAISTYAALGEVGPEIERRTLARLNLSTPNIGWQAARDRFSEYASVAVLISGTLGKIGNELYNLMRTEINEVEEPFSSGKIGSTTMPHKRNPIACAAILTAAQRTPGLVATLYTGQIQQHERALGGWQAEWETLPELMTLVGGALAQSEALVRDMQVFPPKMRADLEITHGLIMAEAVTLALAEFIGKADAHHRIEALCRQALDTSCSLQSVLENDPQVSEHLSADRLTQLLDPTTATGSSALFVRQVVARYKEQLHEC